ncbi:MAG TPA: dehydrogenase E1 component subunit alpha/beta [Acidimicrobiia bacterium]|nr:dehydrogenase E1 component subunit alpha/beta [Acidimicrobiia bacterium]
MTTNRATTAEGNVAVGAAAGLRDEQLTEIYESMVLGRVLETRLHKMYRSGRLPGAVYPGVGQEAAMVGFVAALQPDDIFGGTHRDLTAQLAKGVPLDDIALNFMGKADGPTRGRDGNSHFADFDAGSLMVVSPLPDAYPVAVGTALAFQQRNERRVALANCGEGATATGTWHEAVNFAAVLGLPVVFTIQNNQYAYSTPNERESALSHFADRAAGYGIPGTVVDGNDVLACYDAAAAAVERARNGQGPSIIEAVTFRTLGHAGHDSADYVPAEVRAEWEERDPLARFETYLTDRGILDDELRGQIVAEAEARVISALDWAADQRDPDPATVADGVFAHRLQPVSQPQAPSTGPETTMIDAINSALAQEMRRDESVFIMGEDVGRFGGAFKATAGLYERFGPDRVVDTPIAEMALVGSAVGAALMGRRPVVELQYTDFIYPGLDQLVNEAAKYHWKTGAPVPMVLRGPSGAGLRAGPNHSISPEGLLAHHPGIKVVCPSGPYNAKGLLLASIRDPNPVVYLEHKKLYRSIKEQVPETDYEVPLGTASLARVGTDVTIVAWSAMVHTSLEAADRLQEKGISVEVVDLQTIVPLDWETLFASVAKTSRLVIVQEDSPFASVASEISARAADEMFWDLDTPVKRVTPPHVHVPYAADLEDAYVPQVDDVVTTITALAAR